jgi:hypothetical protein
MRLHDCVVLYNKSDIRGKPPFLLLRRMYHETSFGCQFDGRRALSTWKEFDCKHRLPTFKCIANVYFNDDRENIQLTAFESGANCTSSRLSTATESDIHFCFGNFKAQNTFLCLEI